MRACSCGDSNDAIGAGIRGGAPKRQALDARDPDRWACDELSNSSTKSARTMPGCFNADI
jgi:hypothetical protein